MKRPRGRMRNAGVRQRDREKDEERWWQGREAVKTKTSRMVRRKDKVACNAHITLNHEVCRESQDIFQTSQTVISHLTSVFLKSALRASRGKFKSLSQG